MTIFVVVFILVVAGMFGYAQFKKNQISQTAEPEPNVASEQDSERYASIERIDAKHFYIDGVHTLAGEVVMPTPCDLLTTEAMVAESYPEQVTVDFSVINNAEFCAEVETPQRFKVSFTASAEATISALFNNRVIELNLIPAAPGETPDEFELFIKG